MEDNSSNEFAIQAAAMRNKLEQEAAPKQTEFINKLSVGSLEEKTGHKMLERINESFLSDEKYSNVILSDIGKQLKGLPKSSQIKLTPSGLEQEYTYKYEVRELPHQSEDENFVYLARKSNDFNGRLERLDIFKLPKDAKDIQTVNYSNFLITDTQTGKTANILDTLPKDYQAKYILYSLLSSNITLKEEKAIYFGETYEGSQQINQSIPFTSIVAIHEAGHSLQPDVHNAFKRTPIKNIIRNLKILSFAWQHRKDLFPPEDPQFLPETATKERNAVAYSLAVIRRYRQLGVDLLPTLTNQEVIKECNQVLLRYDKNQVVKTSLKISKLKKTQLV